ncbi:hypothetical protein D3C72_1417220 [compost metagenome]
MVAKALQLGELRLEEMVAVLAPVQIADQQMQAVAAGPFSRMQGAAAIPQPVRQARCVWVDARDVLAGWRLHHGAFGPQRLPLQIAAQARDARMREVDARGITVIQVRAQQIAVVGRPGAHPDLEPALREHIDGGEVFG